MYPALIGFILGLLARTKNQTQRKPDTAKPGQEDAQSKSSSIIITYAPPPLTGEEITEKKADKRREILKYRVEVATLVTLAIYTFFTALMYCANNRAANAAEKAATAAATAASEATLSRVKAQQSLEAAINQFHLDQRAWVGFHEINPSVSITRESNTIGFDISAKNTGKTPARNMTVEVIVIGMAVKDDPPTWEYMDRRARENASRTREAIKKAEEQLGHTIQADIPKSLMAVSKDVLAPGATRIISTLKVNTGPPDPKQPFLERIIRYTFVRIRYSDVFDVTKIRETKICLQYLAGSEAPAIRSCATGNSMD
jgi:hypothetical protein